MTVSRNITIIICTRNRAASLERTLDSLSPNMGHPSLARVVLVDNGSTDHTGSVLSDFEEKHRGVVARVFEPRGGKTYAINSGIEASSSSVLAFTDDDVILSPDWVSQIATALEKYPDCDVFGGRVEPVLPDGMEMPVWVHRSDPLNIAEGPLCDHNKGLSVRSYYERGMCTPVGANVVIRRWLLNLYGAFDSSLEEKDSRIPMSEDSIFFNRLKKNRVKMMYIPSISVSHVTAPERLTKKYFRTYFRKSARSVIRASDRSEAGIRIFNVPWHFYRRLIYKGFLWTLAGLRCDTKGLRFARELDFIYLCAVVGAFLSADKEAGI